MWDEERVESDAAGGRRRRRTGGPSVANTKQLGAVVGSGGASVARAPSFARSVRFARFSVRCVAGSLCFSRSVRAISAPAAFPEGCHAPGAAPEAVTCDHVTLNLAVEPGLDLTRTRTQIMQNQDFRDMVLIFSDGCVHSQSLFRGEDIS